MAMASWLRSVIGLVGIALAGCAAEHPAVRDPFARFKAEYGAKIGPWPVRLAADASNLHAHEKGELDRSFRAEQVACDTATRDDPGTVIFGSAGAAARHGRCWRVTFFPHDVDGPSCEAVSQLVGYLAVDSGELLYAWWWGWLVRYGA